MRSDQDRVVLRAGDLARGYLTKANRASWHQRILSDAQGEFATDIATEAPNEHTLIANLPRQLVIASVVTTHHHGMAV